IRARICRAYGELKFLENDLAKTTDPQERQALIKRLDSMETAANRLPIPIQFADLLYTLKAHINLVRKRNQKTDG
ncbi:MAG: hypothetical protein LBB55_03265, partial [Zoogloeaceae bacterium]|nr:hypothetical protein [Zoogloeaceae bacterium]